MSTAAPNTQPNSERYSVEKQIGRGAYGVAYLCKHKGDGRRCVLKKVRLAKLSHPERQASLTELLILSNIRHRNVLQYQEAWVESGCIACMVVELCECGDLMTQLKARVAQQQYFKEVHLQDMLVQLASCLHFLHINNIAHRDLKSSNVLITADGCLKLADFGLATLLDPENPVSKTMVGTPNYMCPEILKEQPYGVKSDIWALGCVMFELSALKPAFQAFNMEGLTKKITTGPTPHLPSHYSEEWKEVVRSLLSKDQDQRPSAADILKLDWLQPAARRVEERFGPAMPFITKQRVQISDLPTPIAKLAQQFEKQERDAELKAAEDKAHYTEMQAKYAPNALKARMEVEMRKAEAEVAAVRAKLDRQTSGARSAAAPAPLQPPEPRPPGSAVGSGRAGSDKKAPVPGPPDAPRTGSGGRAFMVRRASSDTISTHHLPASAPGRRSLASIGTAGAGYGEASAQASREQGVGAGSRAGLAPTNYSRSISPVSRLDGRAAPSHALGLVAGAGDGERTRALLGIEERKAASCPSLRRPPDVPSHPHHHAPAPPGVSQSVDITAIIAGAGGSRAPPHGRPPLAPQGGHPLRASTTSVPSREAWAVAPGLAASPPPSHDSKGSLGPRRSSSTLPEHTTAPARPPSRGSRHFPPRPSGSTRSQDGSSSGQAPMPGRKSETDAISLQRTTHQLEQQQQQQQQQQQGPGAARKEERRATVTG